MKTNLKTQTWFSSHKEITNLNISHSINVFFLKENVLPCLADALLLRDALSSLSSREFYFSNPSHVKRFLFFFLLLLICITFLHKHNKWNNFFCSNSLVEDGFISIPSQKSLFIPWKLLGSWYLVVFHLIYIFV